MKIKRIYQKGFTLIELLIVIAILGVLAAALLVAINPAQKIAAGRNSTVRSDLSSLGSQANIFNTDAGTNCTFGTFPAGPMTAGVFSGTGCPATATPTYQVMGQDQGAAAGTNYIYKSSLTVGGVVNNCTGLTAVQACVAISISGTSQNDGINAAGAWCYRSATGTIGFVAAAANCTP